MAQLPTVDFNFLETQSKTAKQVLVTFLFLKKIFRGKKLPGKNKTIPELIHAGIMDVKIRETIQDRAEEILKLMSFRVFR